ncbi:MAG: hypothetical protein JNL98_00090 [Bryobacterales bacterium]|nr:hypothetical protein [Bryobacterales bacterium]
MKSAPHVARGPAELDQGLEELVQIDTVLASHGDLLDPEALSMIEKRAGAVSTIASHLERLVADGQAPAEAQVAAIRNSATMLTEMLRKVILAKHQVALEMGQVRQEERLAGFHSRGAAAPTRLDLQG